MKLSIAATGIMVLVSGALVAAVTSSSAAPTPSGSDSSAVSQANRALETHSAAVAAAADESYTVYSSKVDRNGAGHVRYTRTYHGLRVYGGDFVIHTKADGSYAGSSVGLAGPLTLTTNPKVTAAQARQTAQKRFTGKVTSTGAAELFVDASSGRGRLGWETVVSGWAPDGQTPSRLHVISDAVTGAYVGSFDEIETIAGTGNSLYSGPVAVEATQAGSTYTMIDQVHGNGNTCDMNNGTGICTNFTDDDNVWGTGTNASRQSAAVDAAYGAAITFDYYKNVHGRNGIFGTGVGVPSRVHYGNGYNNAGWDGVQMTYGDGVGNARPLVELDVAGHEMTHGVTANVVPGGLTYAGESGGLNEATSDIFGTMVEFYANNAADRGDYQIGELININGDGTPLRYMYDPALDGVSHSCWSSNTKNVNVHYSSGVANHFYFDLAEGTGATAYGTSPVCGAAPAVTGIGRDKAQKIWFRALDTYFTSNTSYVNPTTPSNTARAYSLAATTDLYGLCSPEYKTVQAAWTAVNVAGNDALCPTPNDFAVSVAPVSASVDPGASVTTTVNTAVTNGSAEPVTFSATGLPAGARASFEPATVPAGGSATVTIATAATTPVGGYPVTITGTSPSNAHSAIFTLSVNGPPGCSGTNPTDVPIPDVSTAESSITISGCAVNASSNSAVEVHIVHTYIGDLVVTLVAPDGSTYPLANRTGGSADNINQTYAVNLSTEVGDGIWKLRVQDAAGGDVGYIDSWSLNLGGASGGSCTASNPADVAIPDNTTVNSPVTIANCAGNGATSSSVEVHIVHTWVGDLTVSLVAPGGRVYLLRGPSGGSADNIDTIYPVDLSAEARNGTWSLRVQDNANGDTGFINTWTLTL